MSAHSPFTIATWSRNRKRSFSKVWNSVRNIPAHCYECLPIPHLLLPRDPGTEKEVSLKSGILSVTSQHTAMNACPFPIQTVLCNKRLPLMWNSEEMLWTTTLLTWWYCKSRSAPMDVNTRSLLCVPRSLKYVVSLGQTSLLASQLLGEMVGLSIMPNGFYICVDVIQTDMTHPEY